MNKVHTDSKNEVHINSEGYDCGHMPETQNRVPVGRHISIEIAVSAAKGKGWEADPCFYCQKHEEDEKNNRISEIAKGLGLYGLWTK